MASHIQIASVHRLMFGDQTSSRRARGLSYYGTPRASTAAVLPDSLSIIPREEEVVETMRLWRLKMREWEVIVCDMGDRVEDLMERLKDSEDDWEAEVIQEEMEYLMTLRWSSSPSL